MPAPFGPVIAIRSRPWTVRSTSRSSGSSQPAVTPRRAATSRPPPPPSSSTFSAVVWRGFSMLLSDSSSLLEPPLARLRLPGHLLGVALEPRRLRPAHRGLGVQRVAAGGRDVGLEPAPALLLGLVVELEPRRPARLLVAVGGVAALVGGQTVAVELEDLRDRGVEEAAVVRDDEHGAGEAGQELLEPCQAVEVEVVGRLVEQQDGRPGEQHAGQQRARRLAARQRAERRVERHVGDARARRARRRAAPAAPSRRARRSAPAPRRSAASAAGSSSRRFEPLELAVQPPHLAERGAEQAVDRQLRPRRLLGQVADPVARPERDRSALRSVDAREQPQQRRLAGAVGTDEADAPVARQRQAEPFEDRVVAVLGVQVGCRERHRERGYRGGRSTHSEAGRTPAPATRG